MKITFNNYDVVEAQEKLLGAVSRCNRFSDSSTFKAIQAHNHLEAVTEQFEFLVRWFNDPEVPKKIKMV